MSPKTMKLLAKPMLFAAAIIWGTSFFIMKNALDALPPFYLLAIRFTAGSVSARAGKVSVSRPPIQAYSPAKANWNTVSRVMSFPGETLATATMWEA